MTVIGQIDKETMKARPTGSYAANWEAAKNYNAEEVLNSDRKQRAQIAFAQVETLVDVYVLKNELADQMKGSKNTIDMQAKVDSIEEATTPSINRIATIIEQHDNPNKIDPLLTNQVENIAKETYSGDKKKMRAVREIITNILLSKLNSPQIREMEVAEMIVSSKTR